MVRSLLKTKEARTDAIRQALEFLDRHEPSWGLKKPIGKQSYIDEMFGRGAYAAYMRELTEP